MTVLLVLASWLLACLVLAAVLSCVWRKVSGPTVDDPVLIDLATPAVPVAVPLVVPVPRAALALEAVALFGPGRR